MSHGLIMPQSGHMRSEHRQPRQVRCVLRRLRALGVTGQGTSIGTVAPQMCNGKSALPKHMQWSTRPERTGMGPWSGRIGCTSACRRVGCRAPTADAQDPTLTQATPPVPLVAEEEVLHSRTCDFATSLVRVIQRAPTDCPGRNTDLLPDRDLPPVRSPCACSADSSPTDSWPSTVGSCLIHSNHPLTAQACAEDDEVWSLARPAPLRPWNCEEGSLPVPCQSRWESSQRRRRETGRVGSSRHADA